MRNVQSLGSSLCTHPRIGHELPPSIQAEIARATAEWLKGESFMFLNQTDKAVPIVKTALARVEHYAPGTKLHGDLMRSRGAIAAIKGNVVAAMTDYLSRRKDRLQEAYKQVIWALISGAEFRFNY